MLQSSRLAAGLVAGGAALFLLVPTANAALGGANALTTSLRPDLRSATVQSTNAVDDTTTVRVCFNKAIASLPQASRFEMGAYADDDPGDGETATSATRSTSNCADAVFPNSDAEQFTYVTVDGSDGTAPDSGSSAVSTNGFGNISDSTALVGSKTHNGTRGFSTAPDLVGITVNNAAATIDYTFDQRVGGLTLTGESGPGFSYNLPDGTAINSLNGAANRALSSDGLTVRVNFPPGPQIQDAVRAYVAENAVIARTPQTPQTRNGLRHAARPGSGGFTDRPDLVAITLAPDGSTMDFQFDQTLSTVAGGGFFTVYTAGGAQFGPGGVPAIVGGAGVGNTVRVAITTAPGGTNMNELIVAGSAFEGAATGVGGVDSTAGGLPTGGNAGAFATGFTAAPEALNVTFDNATDVAHVLFDQRWETDVTTAFKLLDDQGSQISAGAVNVAGGGATAAGQTTADVTFPAGTLAGARSLLIQPLAVRNSSGYDNRVQVVSPTAPAANLAKKFRRLKVAKRR